MKFMFTGEAARNHRAVIADLVRGNRRAIDTNTMGAWQEVTTQLLSTIPGATAGEVLSIGSRQHATSFAWEGLNWSCGIYQRALLVTVGGATLAGEIAPDAVSVRLNTLMDAASRIWFSDGPDSYGRLSMYLVFDTNSIKLPNHTIASSGGQLVRTVPVGERVAQRDNVALYRSAEDPAKVRWALSGGRAGAVGQFALIDGVAVPVSPEFLPNDLLPISVGSELDITSYYWHPTREKIRKLNNIAAPHVSQHTRAEVLGLGGHAVVRAQRYHAPHNSIIEEYVLIGERVAPHDKLQDSVRRRLLRLTSDEGETVKLDSAYLLGGCSACNDDEERQTYRLPVSLRGEGMNSMSHLVVTRRAGQLVATMPLQSVGVLMCNNARVFTDGARPYELLAENVPEEAAHAGHPAIAALPITARDNIFLTRVNRVSYIVKRMTETSYGGLFIDNSEEWWAVNSVNGAPNGVFRIDADNERQAWAKASAMTTLFNPSTDDVTGGFDGTKLNDLVALLDVPDHYGAHSSLPTVRYDGRDYVWLESWGESPFLTAYSNDSENLEVKVPVCGRQNIKQCAHCGDNVLFPEYTDMPVYTDGEVKQHQALCGVCAGCGDGHGAILARSPDTGFFQCNDCGVLYPRAHMSSHDDTCDSCYEAHYSECDRCHGTYHTVRMRDGVCSNCREQGSRLREYNFTPKLIFHRTKPEEAICYGVEIELETVGKYGSNEDVAEAANRVLDYPGCKNFLIAKRDGSLMRGAEFVSQPFSWEWFKDNTARFQDIFGKMREWGFQQTPSCGLHIHASRSPHSSLEEFRLLQLVYENSYRWIKATKRKGNMHYCRFQENWLGLKDRIRVSRERGRFIERYTALNPTTKDTLEWRMWAGVDTQEDFTSALAMTVGAHAFARSGATGVRPKWDKFATFVTNSEYGAHAASRLALAAS